MEAGASTARLDVSADRWVARLIEGRVARWARLPAPLAGSILFRSLIATLTFGLPMFVIFLFLLLPNRGSLSVRYLLTYILAATWLLLAPFLISMWDYRMQDLIGTIAGAPVRDGWNRVLLRDRVLLAKRIFPWIMIVFVIAILSHYVHSYGFYQSFLSIGPKWRSVGFWVGSASVAFLAWTFAVGVWGVLKTILLVDVTSDSKLRFAPYEVDQIPGIEHATTTYYLTGIYFSLGNVLTPAVLLNYFSFDLSGQVIAVVVLAALELGGLSCFLYTSLRMSRLAHSQAVGSLNRFSGLLEAWASEVDSGNPAKLIADKDAIDAVIQLREAAMRVAASPLSLNIAGRMAVLIIIPAALTVVQPILSLLGGK